MRVSACNPNGFGEVAMTIFQQILFARRSCNRDCKSQMRQRPFSYLPFSFLFHHIAFSTTFKSPQSPALNTLLPFKSTAAS